MEELSDGWGGSWMKECQGHFCSDRSDSVKTNQIIIRI